MMKKNIQKFCHEVALTSLDISYHAHTGHIGSALSISDLVAVLYAGRLDVKKDRFILSKGHAAAALYSVLYHKKIMGKKLIDSFGADTGGLCEHPEMKDPGIEMTSGSLGHGLAFASGIALGYKKINKKPPHVFVLISDGECGEGSVWEAAIFASRMKLDNLTVIVDYNKWQCFGASSEITPLEPFAKKWQSFGFSVHTIDGHNIEEINKTYHRIPFEKDAPSVIIANTVSDTAYQLLKTSSSDTIRYLMNLNIKRQG